MRILRGETAADDSNIDFEMSDEEVEVKPRRKKKGKKGKKGGRTGRNVVGSLVGGEDSPAPARRVSELLAAILPDARQAVLRNAGHMLPLTHAQTLAALICGHLANVEDATKRAA